jgi:inner membrane protein
MDTLTHALSGALLARATAPRRTGSDVLPLGRRIGLGFFAAAFPDIDIVASFLSPLSYLYHHRGVTHSLLLLPLWTMLLAWGCSRVWRSGPGWRAYFGVFAWGLGIHIAGDWITSFGTMVFAPFSDERYALSTTFIIDLWFTGIIVAGLVAAALWRRTRMPAVAGIALLCVYVGFQFVMHHEAVRFGEEYAQSRGYRDATVTATPRPVSPYNWMVMVGEGEQWHYAFVNLRRREPRPAGDGFFATLDKPYLPLASARWETVPKFGEPELGALAREAYRQPQFAFFRWFSEYPSLFRVDRADHGVCVWFQDLRFHTPGRSSWPFRYGMCREGDLGWQPFQWLSDRDRMPVY